VSGGRERALAYLGLALASVGWAAAFVLGKVAVAELSPLVASSLRYVLATAALLPFAARAWPQASGHLRGVAAPLAGMTIAGGVLYQWLFLEAVARTSATNAALLVATNPVVTVLLAPLVGER
jgi:drug/metabolite transporter (DMT)-like permease